MAGCIIIPTQMPDEKPFKDERLAFIEIGTTTKEQVATAMSNFKIHTDEGEVTVKLNPQKFRGGDRWLYAQDREELQLVFGAYGGGGGTLGDVDYHFLLIKFDEDGVVSDYKVSSIEGDGCNRDGVCKGSVNYMLLASEDEDLAAKHFQPPVDSCGIYFYGNPHLPVEAWLDGQPAGWLLNKKLYLFWLVNPGERHLFIRAIPPSSHQKLAAADFKRRAIHFNCEAGRIYFFEPTYQTSRFTFGGLVFPDRIGQSRLLTELEQRDAATGRGAIGKRQLVLSNWDASLNARPIILSPDMDLDGIVTGVTNREDLIARFGPPDIESNEYGLMVYIKDGPAWFELIGVENGTQSLGQQYLLFIRFDSDGMATGYELRSVNSILDSSTAYMTWKETAKAYEHIQMNLNCTSDGFCVAPGGIFARYATGSESIAARKRSARAKKNECVMNIFGEREYSSFSGQRDTSWRLTLNGEFAGNIHDTAWPKAFHQWRLPPGEYLVTAEALGKAVQLESEVMDTSDRSHLATEKITCKTRNNLYFSLRLERNRPSLDLIEDDLGEIKLRHRNLILSEF